MKNVVFIDIDTQHDFVDTDGALSVPNATAIRENLRKLTTFARERNVPVIQTMDHHPADDPDFERFPPHCVQGTPGQKKIEETCIAETTLIPYPPGDLTNLPEGSSYVVQKEFLDIFDNPAFERLLERLGRPTCLVYGVTTEYCVRIAVLGLLRRGYRTIVLTDAISAVDDGAGETALGEMLGEGAEFQTTGEILKSLGRDPAGEL
jgi:nicotinamidase/pyrazinamidase